MISSAPADVELLMTAEIQINDEFVKNWKDLFVCQIFSEEILSHNERVWMWIEIWGILEIFSRFVALDPFSVESLVIIIIVGIWVEFVCVKRREIVNCVVHLLFTRSSRKNCNIAPPPSSSLCIASLNANRWFEFCFLKRTRTLRIERRFTKLSRALHYEFHLSLEIVSRFLQGK
jgi:hypothetical protein